MRGSGGVVAFWLGGCVGLCICGCFRCWVAFVRGGVACWNLVLLVDFG